VNIHLDSESPSTLTLTIEGEKTMQKYFGLTSNDIIFTPKLEGEYFLKLFDKTSLFDEKNFSVKKRLIENISLSISTNISQTENVNFSKTLI
jgi:hypothetical protein